MSKYSIKDPYQPKNFLDMFVPEEVTFDNANAVVVPFGYEGTVTFGHGTNNGPKALIEASWQVESFDDELLDDLHNKVKIWTSPQPALPTDPLEACTTLRDVVVDVINANKLPVVIGGEHSISYGFAQALAAAYPTFSIVVFDSHLDLGDRYSGKDFTHAAWLKYSLDLRQVSNATLFGIRNYNKMEWEYWKNNMNRVTVYQANEKASWNTTSFIDNLADNVFISFDIDAFDPSVMPATGTPEPGGLLWNDVLPIIKNIAAKKNIVGLDLVELAPITGMHAPDFMAAKLLMKMIMYAIKGPQSTPI
jgi:agmatinase